MWFKKEKEQFYVLRIIFKNKQENFRIKIKVNDSNKSEWPIQFKEVSDWFYYNTKQNVFSYKHFTGVTLFRKEDVLIIDISKE